MCTAYYLTQHPDFDADKHHITIIEARRPASGASGKAGGLLALWAFPQQIVPLSFRLHQELAEQYDGANEWGYRRVSAVSIAGNLQKAAARRAGHNEGHPTKTAQASRKKIGPNLPEDLDWTREGLVESWSQIGDTETTAQVHPYRFTTYILRKVLQTGAAELVIGKVTRYGTDSDGRVVSVTYDRASESPGDDPPGREQPRRSPPDEVTLQADKVVVTAGPWTSKILPECPVSGLRAHSITIAPTRQLSAHALFAELRIGKNSYTSPEIYPRRDEVYVCGEGDNLVPVPASTDDVEVDRAYCDELFKYAGEISDDLRGGRVLRRQACYLPVVNVPSASGPFIGYTNVPGLLVAAGHNCWGINNAPGTGKVMAELILEGRAHSARLAGLEPTRHFEVAV